MHADGSANTSRTASCCSWSTSLGLDERVDLTEPVDTEPDVLQDPGIVPRDQLGADEAGVRAVQLLDEHAGSSCGSSATSSWRKQKNPLSPSTRRSTSLAARAVAGVAVDGADERAGDHVRGCGSGTSPGSPVHQEQELQVGVVLVGERPPGPRRTRSTGRSGLVDHHHGHDWRGGLLGGFHERARLAVGDPPARVTRRRRTLHASTRSETMKKVLAIVSSVRYAACTTSGTAAAGGHQPEEEPSWSPAPPPPARRPQLTKKSGATSTAKSATAKTARRREDRRCEGFQRNDVVDQLRQGSRQVGRLRLLEVRPPQRSNCRTSWPSSTCPSSMSPASTPRSSSHAVRDAAYISVGFGVLAVQQAQRSPPGARRQDQRDLQQHQRAGQQGSRSSR